ncbi:MAG: peptidoglycan bridge formation glycyltransferase FemA/FemB family protein [Nitrospirae bacterium]|nr:peptidoglycan bridge formation glycyltransferase FemA/FemB family protein [Nitrospirota bacterium]MBF0554099.1 peptidoglycan bridge formation glycyltransferase FemA/FemB family protein [Nitrospirota bacterium]
MIEWDIYTKDCGQQLWDSSLLQASDHNIFQSYKWGALKQTEGWLPVRCIARNKETVVMMVQILFKTFPLHIHIGWAPGGPCIYFPKSKHNESDKILKTLFVELTNKIGKKIHIRFYCTSANSPELAYKFNRVFVRPFYKINSGFSVVLDMSYSMGDLMQKMTSKHRYYVKKSLSEDITWENKTCVNSMNNLFKIYNKMAEKKQLKKSIKTERELVKMCSTLDNYINILEGCQNNKVITSCLILSFGDKAFYLLAVTSEEGRTISASYAMIYRLFDYLKSRNITELDFGGIAPASIAAEGVDHFKKGFGGKMIEYLGEWEWSSSEWLRLAFNILMKIKNI